MRRRTLLLGAGVLAAGVAAWFHASTRTISCPRYRRPDPGELNPHVLAVLATYPTDGTHRYWWPKEGDWKGNVRTLHYGTDVLCAGDPEGRCHCSGLTFEVFVQAWQRWQRERPEVHDPAWLGAGVADARRLQAQWFGSPSDRTTIRTAFVENRLGTCLADWEQARAGDFVQLWRHDGSGHCAVFLAWERDAAGTITGVRYWSTQASTDGIGEKSEFFGAEGRAVKRDELYLCRAGVS
jgi:hypothetical protein